MYSSAKFLSPSTTGGLPTPGPLVAGVAVPPVVEVGAAAAVLLAAELVVLDVVVELELDEPHAASPAASAIVNRARRPRRTCGLLMLPPVCLSSWKFGHRWNERRRLACPGAAPELQAARR